MNTIKESAPLPRVHVLAIEYRTKDLSPIFKARSYSCLNYIFIMQVVCWVLDSAGKVGNLNMHLPIVLISAIQIWVGVFLVYNATRWLFAWILGSKKKVQIIG